MVNSLPLRFIASTCVDSSDGSKPGLSLGQRRSGAMPRACSTACGIVNRIDESSASGAGFWLGFRRLAILDLSDHARQPMSFGAERYTLAFNGEIYNYRELRPHDLPSTGDTAVLGALLESKPVDQVLHQLRGMFAFAWWDQAERSLLVARDHFGIKPLYYCVSEQGDLWIGSELRSVHALSGKGEPHLQAALGDCLSFRRGAGPTRDL